MPRTLRTAKSTYVGAMQGLGARLNRLGALSWLERHQQVRAAHWVRSLFAIYDIDGLIRLDVPWWTYGAIIEVEQFLETRPAARAFEFGSGASSVWLARRTGSLTSIEHDAAWYPIVEERLREFEHADLMLIPPDDVASEDPVYLSKKEGQEGLSFAGYAMAIDASPTLYDLIVIDGRARAACLDHAVRHLAPGGMIVFDNSKRARYDRAIRASGLTARVFSGLTPSLPYPDRTTVLEVPHGDG